MGVLPTLKLGNLDIGKTVEEFLDLLRSMNAKLDVLIEQSAGARLGEALADAEDVEADDPRLQAKPMRLR
jgi:hypothetical protein